MKLTFCVVVFVGALVVEKPGASLFDELLLLLSISVSYFINTSQVTAPNDC